MRFKTHLAFSFFLFLLIWPLIEDFAGEKWLFALLFVIAGVFPDIDTSKSRPGRFLLFGWALQHRGVFHSIWPAILFFIILEIFFPGYGLAFFLGYLSHLVLDMLNSKGIGFFYPFLKHRIKGSIKADGVMERFLFLIFIAGIAVMLLLFF